MDLGGLKMQNFDEEYLQSIERARCRCIILLESICKV